MASLHDASFYCITEHELPTEKRLIYFIIGVISASLGLIGSSWQIFSYIPETQNFMRRANQQTQETLRREHNPIIVLCLAFTNLASCVGSVLRSVGIFLVSSPSGPTDNGTSCITYTESTFTPTVSTSVKVLGSILEAFTDFSYIASALWTLSFAINIYYQLRTGKHIPVKYFHILTWLVSLACVAGGVLSIYAGTGTVDKCAGELRIFGRYVATYTPMVVTLVLLCVLYWKASASVSLSFTQLTSTFGHEERAIIQRLRFRFFWIVFFFGMWLVFYWYFAKQLVPGFAQVMLWSFIRSTCKMQASWQHCTFVQYKYHHHRLTSISSWLPNIVDSIFHINILSKECLRNLHEQLFPLWIIEALLNPLQGLLNCFLYGRKCFCKPFVFTARTRRHYTQIPDGGTDRSYTGLLNNSS